MLASLTELIESGQSLGIDETRSAVDMIMRGGCSVTEVKRFLSALHHKGETADELVGAAMSLRDQMNVINSDRTDLVDTCGTGGGGTGIFNVSTAAAIVAAAAGVAVAKHGNRKVTGKSGSADVLVELGVNIDASKEAVERCLDELGICFCFAPLFHPSVRNVMQVRNELPHPTIFNLLGPLCNPARTQYQLLGAGRGETQRLLAEALAKLGTKRSFVVHGDDGLGEITNATSTTVLEINDGQIDTISWSPEDFGKSRSLRSEIEVNSPAQSAMKIRSVLDGKTGPEHDIVVINAAAAIKVVQKEKSFVECVLQCEAAIANKQALMLLDALRKLSRQ
jgi:anthranilate phosphoribosyltransferase